jgi:aminomethyltransferase
VVASSYELNHEMEYFAIRHSAALIDVSPLFKYHIKGRGAEALANVVVTRDVRKCAPGQIMYTPWCDGRGKTVDDGTLWRLEDDSFRMTSAEPNLAWLQDNGEGVGAEVEDVTEELAVVALQGPTSRAVLRDIMGPPIEGLRFFRFTQARLDGIPATVSRTGYTGDLGYEIWVDPGHAESLWDLLMDRGKGHGITPTGMLALDMARIEAGFILSEVDYVPARKALIDAQRYSPLELGLDWTVALEKGPFVGAEALRGEHARGPPRRIVGLEVAWPAVEKLFERLGLPAEPPRAAWRSAIPVYAGGRQVGRATSGTWSPLLKRYIALATVASPFAPRGTQLLMEYTLEGEHHRVPAQVVKRPFFDPERKRA